jgi:acetyl esterase/lipase
MIYPEIKVIGNNPALEGMARVVPDIVYSTATGSDLKLTLMLPWSREDGAAPALPLVLFVQGSAWTHPDIYFEIPQLCQLARDGYAVATIEHRNSLDGNPFPAYLQDTKTAIRFLRANAAEYGIDPRRVCIYGTSSGGNTALLVGVTGDDERFKTDEYREFSDAVQLVAECFGPANLTAMVDMASKEAEDNWGELFGALAGKNEMADVFKWMSPVEYLRPGAKYPPFLIMHGDADALVPYEQSVEMYHRLIDCGADARMICVKGAPHEGSFWSRELIADIYGFIQQKL